MVTRIICSSVSRVEGSVMDELFRVRERICRKGGTTSVRGSLLYCAGWFVLWLEGPADEVEAARARAASHPRNAHLKVIHRSEGPATLQALATVVMVQSAARPADVWKRIVRLENASAGMEPAAIWDALCAPSVGPGVPQRRVALVAAEDTGPIHLLQNLAAPSQGRLVYQRIADSRRLGSDVGVAYVDIPSGGRVVRVQLMSRRALGQELVRHSLEGVDDVVLIRGLRESANIDLAEHVADCCDALAARAIWLGEAQVPAFVATGQAPWSQQNAQPARGPHPHSAPLPLPLGGEGWGEGVPKAGAPERPRQRHA